jgi:proliferating cell nuclear antigen PCNA
MTVIFKAKTREGYCLKILAELLQNNIKTACFEIDNSGIRLRMMDHHRTILIDLEMDSDKFSVYKFKSNTKMYLGINLTHFHKMLKSIKKRDSIQLYIDESSPTDLGIKVIPKENNRITTSFIKIQTIQNLDIDLPDDYSRSVIVPSGEFQKMCKGLTHISNLTHITSKGFLIRFGSDAGGVMKRSTEFGETEDSEEESSEEKDDEPEYSEEFDTEQLTRITKLAGLGTTMQIYPKSERPLKFRSTIGSLGVISIYLKSKSLQEVESHAVESDEE